MPVEPRVGRPKASSRETIAEAACELFLERGYEQTTVADIASRAGVGRSSFFNYFASKSDVLWAGLDERIAAFAARVVAADPAEAAASVESALRAVAEGFAPDSLALALVNTDVMGLGDEFERDAGLRRSRIAHAVAGLLRDGGFDPLHAEVAGAAYGSAVLASIRGWALAGAGQRPLALVLTDALAFAAPLLSREA